MTPPVYANWCTRRFINVQSMVSRNGCPRKFWRLHLSIFGQQPRCQKQRTTPDEPSDSLQFISLHSPIWSRYNDSEALQKRNALQNQKQCCFQNTQKLQTTLFTGCMPLAVPAGTYHAESRYCKCFAPLRHSFPHFVYFYNALPPTGCKKALSKLTAVHICSSRWRQQGSL